MSELIDARRTHILREGWVNNKQVSQRSREQWHSRCLNSKFLIVNRLPPSIVDFYKFVIIQEDYQSCSVYGRIGSSGSEEVILQSIRFKCMPCLFYALEACPVNKTQLRSLEFTFNRVFMKVFRTTSMEVIAECRYWFGLLEMETLIGKRKQRFMAKYTFSLTTFYVNCSLVLRMCNLWQLRHYLFFSFLFYLCLLYLFFSCLLPINLVNKVD